MATNIRHRRKSYGYTVLAQRLRESEAMVSRINEQLPADYSPSPGAAARPAGDKTAEILARTKHGARKVAAMAQQQITNTDYADDDSDSDPIADVFDNQILAVVDDPKLTAAEKGAKIAKLLKAHEKIKGHLADVGGPDVDEEEQVDDTGDTVPFASGPPRRTGRVPKFPAVGHNGPAKPRDSDSGVEHRYANLSPGARQLVESVRATEDWSHAGNDTRGVANRLAGIDTTEDDPHGLIASRSARRGVATLTEARASQPSEAARRLLAACPPIED